MHEAQLYRMQLTAFKGDDIALDELYEELQQFSNESLLQLQQLYIEASFSDKLLKNFIEPIINSRGDNIDEEE